jgi:hypothetical protein
MNVMCLENTQRHIYIHCDERYNPRTSTRHCIDKAKGHSLRRLHFDVPLSAVDDAERAKPDCYRHKVAGIEIQNSHPENNLQKVKRTINADSDAMYA